MKDYPDNERTRRSRRSFSSRLVKGDLAEIETKIAIRMIREMLQSGDLDRMQSARIGALMRHANELDKSTPDIEEVLVRRLAEDVRDGSITLAGAAERLVRFGIRDEMVGAKIDELVTSEGISFAEAAEQAGGSVMGLGDFPIKPTREPGESLIAFDKRASEAERRMKNARKRLERVLTGRND